MTILQKIKNINWQNIRDNKLYKRFASLKTSVILFTLLSGFYVLGTIFPQGGRLEDYINAGGRFKSLVIFFDLLDIFTTPVFLITALIFFMNLAICTFERFLLLWKQSSALPEDISFIPSHTITLDKNLDNPPADIRGIFKKELKFKEQPVGKTRTHSTAVFERGWSYRWLTWTYHLAILFCFFGFFLTYLFAFEDEITIYAGETKAVKPNVTSRWNKRMGRAPQEFDYKLMLDEFITEYNQFPKLDYPAERLSRLAVAMGWKAPQYILEGGSFFPKDWKSRLKIIREGAAVLEKTIEVNDPLYYRGITFYQAAYKQNLKIQMDDNPILLETEIGKELIVPGMDGMLKFGIIKTGTLFKKDGRVEEILPFTDVTLIKKDSSGATESKKVGKLELDGSIVIDGKIISMKEFKEASILSYRRDPGVPLLWWAGILVMLAMALRIFGAWYRVAYRIEMRNNTPCLLLTIKTRGLLADEERLLKRLKHSLDKISEPIDLDTPV